MIEAFSLGHGGIAPWLQRCEEIRRDLSGIAPWLQRCQEIRRDLSDIAPWLQELVIVSVRLAS
jgi:hypothetical protein